MKYRTRRRKPLMCRIGLHKPSGDVCLTVRKCSSHRKGKHRWHRTYELCARCGKKISVLAVQKTTPPSRLRRDTSPCTGEACGTVKTVHYGKGDKGNAEKEGKKV